MSRPLVLMLATGLVACEAPLPALSVSPTNIQYANPIPYLSPFPPVQTFTVRLDAEPEVELQIHVSTTHEGIDHVDQGPVDSRTAVVQCVLAMPTRWALGDFEDTLTIAVCLDGDCQQQVPGSPVTARLGYRMNLGP